MKRLLSAILAILLAAGCAPVEKDSVVSTSDTDPIAIGTFVALTGETATFGQAGRDGAMIAVDEINESGGILGGRKITLKIEDTQSKAEEAAVVVTKMITKDRVIGLIGENASSRSLAAAPICQANRIPMISPSSTNPEVTKKGDYIFRVCFTDPYQGKAIARFVRNGLKATRVAILRDIRNDYSVGLAQFFEESFVPAGGKIVINQSYSEGDVDFRSQLTAIRNAKPEVIFIPGYYTAVGQIAVQARDLGITIPLVGGDGWDSPRLLEIGGASMNNSYFANHNFVDEPRAEVQSFVAKYRARFKRDPDSVAALSYDAVRILVNAISKAGSIDTARIRDQIAATKDYPGVSGVISMGPDRNPLKPVAILAVRDGKLHFREWITP